MPGYDQNMPPAQQQPPRTSPEKQEKKPGDKK
jgi:hypothetical protein